MQKEIIEGSLLGDGSLTRIDKSHKNSSFREKHSLKQQGYLSKKCEHLLDLNSKINFWKDKDKKACTLTTKSTNDLTGLELKWYLRDNSGDYVLDKYGKRIKILPNDLILTPLMTAIWFFDDGYNDPNSNSKNYFSNINFTLDEKQKLRDMLLNLGIKTYLVKRQDAFVIRISAGSCVCFRDLIKESGSNFLSEDIIYKVQSNRIIVPRNKLKESDVFDVVNMANNGLSNKQIALQKCVSSVTISNILHGKTWQAIMAKPLQVNRNNKSGVTGVYFRKDRNKWAVQFNRKTYGLFDSLEEAVSLRKSLVQILGSPTMEL